MTPNQLPSEGLALIGSVDPVSQAAGTVTTAWIPAAQYYSFMAVVKAGVFGALATVDAKIRQATDASGTNAKDVTGKAITQLLAAGGNNRQAMINFRATDLDANNNFNYVQLSLTVGAAATLVSADVWGVYPRFEPVTQPVAVAQVV